MSEVWTCYYRAEDGSRRFLSPTSKMGPAMLADGWLPEYLLRFDAQGTPKPLPPDEITPLPASVGIEEGRGGSRRGDKCACGTYLDDAGRCVNADMEHRLAPPPPPPAPEGFAIPEIRSRRRHLTMPKLESETPDVRIRKMVASRFVRYRIGGPEGALDYAMTLRAARRKARRMQRRIDAARAFNG